VTSRRTSGTDAPGSSSESHADSAGHEYRADIVNFLCARALRPIATADADILVVHMCTTGLGQSVPSAQFAHAFSR
jgi:hypothetical protein